MSSHASLEPESFESFLANAFAVQNSGLNPEVLSALIEVQHSISTDELTVDRALDLIADHALKVSHASGIAIALLEGNQLVYRAGSGVAAVDVGRRVPAVLSVRAPNNVGVEILRVENAKTDSRIEAEICRQFGAISLLILPIYQAQAVAGVLQVHFVEAHTFLDEEVRAYRLMGGLVEEAILRNVQRRSEKTTKESATVEPATWQNILQDVRFESAETQQGQPSAEDVTSDLTTFSKEASAQNPRKIYRLSIVKLWRVGAAGSAAMLLAIAIWLAHGHHPAPTVNGPVTSAPSDNVGTIVPEPLSPSDESQGATYTSQDRRAPSPAFRRVRMGPNEVDYIAEDVTIRNFTSPPAGHQTRINFKEVNIGQDVTVRYFSTKSTRSPTASGPD